MPVAALAQRLIGLTCAKQEIGVGQLTIHADRGGSMTSKPVALLLADLGVTRTHSRPHVSNDNPFSEAQFKTLKYRPDFPERFASLEAARAFCQPFFTWYNTQHRHGGVAWLTPATVHHGHGEPVRARRAEVLAAAYAAHPERFVRQPPQPPRLPPAVWINPPTPPALPTGSHGADGLWATATIAPGSTISRGAAMSVSPPSTDFTPPTPPATLGARQ